MPACSGSAADFTQVDQIVVRVIGVTEGLDTFVTPIKLVGEEPLPAAVGDFVWNDTNEDGIQDDGEPGIEDVPVQLYECEDGTAIGDPDPPTLLTDADGNYLFDELPAGEYQVCFLPPAGYVMSPPDQGVDDTVDSDAYPDSKGQCTVCFSLAAGETDLTQDAGMYEPAPPLGELGDRLWHDLDADGIQDAGEPGIEGVLVTLTQPGDDGVCGTDDDGAAGTDTTEADGLYLFEDLPAGAYCVAFARPDICTSTEAQTAFSPEDQGADDGADSDVDSDGRTGVIPLAEGQSDRTWDAGVYCPARLGDRVWEDTNADGVQDDGEPDYEGMTVNLFDCADRANTADLGTPKQTTATDANGNYGFDVTPGCYFVQFVLPDDPFFTEGFSPQNSPLTTDDLDSDPADSGLTIGQTEDIIMESDEVDPTWDAGLTRSLDVNPDVAICKGDDGNTTEGDPGTDCGANTYTVTEGGNFTFWITVTNVGTEPLRNVVVTDPALPACDKDWSAEDIANGDQGGVPVDGDGILEPNESFQYSCTDPLVTVGYTNTAFVAGVGIASDTTVEADDPATLELEPALGGQGCTPGYWKQKQHFDSWVGYVPDGDDATLFVDVFGVDAFPDMTLLDVLKQGGGGLKALGRHTVAALLNAASGIDYDIVTPEQVIAQFNAVYPSTKAVYEAKKDDFADFNEQGCPLN
jgi:uncharacterized repeat protein (TIGR01451 family)